MGTRRIIVQGYARYNTRKRIERKLLQRRWRGGGTRLMDDGMRWTERALMVAVVRKPDG